MVIEIKRSSAPTVSKGFRLACDDLSPQSAFVVHSGTDRWPMTGQVTATSLVELMRQLEQSA